MHWIYPIAFLAVLCVVAFVAQQLLLKRAVKQVVAIFKEHRAFTPDTARTLAEMKLEAPGFLKRPATFRDFKNKVVLSLLSAGIVMVTEDNRYYLSRDALARSPISELLDPPR